MPIYEYRCDSCETTVEKRQRFSDPLLTECEICGGPLRKLMSAPGLQFKGSGWYITDYAAKGNGKNGKPAAEPKSETKSEKKPAKADSKPAASAKSD